MKKLLFLLLLIPFLGTSQGTFTAPVGYNTGTPTAAPSGVGTRWRFDLLTGKKYTWLPGSMAWDEDAAGIDQVSGCASPAYTPGYNQSNFAVNSCSTPELYQYYSSAWHCLNCGGGTNISAGSGITITGAAPDITISADDNSPTNELQTLSIAGQDLTLSNGGGTVAIPGSIEPINQIAYGTGTGIDSDANLKKVSDTLLINQGRLKIKSTLADPKIIIDNRKPFSYTSGTVTDADYIATFFPTVNRSVENADTAANFYIWNTYTKYQAGQLGNSVFGMGQNLGPGNVKVLANYPATGFSIESFYQPLVGGEGLSEFVMTWIPKTLSARRPFAWYGNNTTNIMDVQFQTDRMSIYNPTSSKEVFNVTGGQFIFRGEGATGSSATARLFFEDQRNLTKRGSFVCDTATMSIAAPKVLTIGCNDVTGWLNFTQRIAYTNLIFGTSNTQNRVFFETQDDATGYYKSGGSILLGGYCSLAKIANNAYGAVGSNYYLDGSGVLKRASADVSSGWNFENGGARFWAAATGAANSTITLTHKASFDASGNLSLASTSNPSYTLDAGSSTGAIRIPSGTTAQAPTGAAGVMRLNTTTGTLGVVLSGTTYSDVLTNKSTLSVSTGTTSAADASAQLDIVSTTKGMLPPRMTTAQRNAIASPATGLTLYCTDCTATDTSTGVMQTYNGANWKNNW